MDQKELLKLPYENQLSYWVGFMCLAIGRGDLKSALSQIIFFYQTEAYERGQAAGKKIGGKNNG